MLQNDLPKANATCEVCGRPYYVCKPCIENRDKGIFGYKLVCCSHDCYKIYLDRLNKEPELVKHVKEEIMNPEHEYEEIGGIEKPVEKKPFRKHKK